MYCLNYRSFASISGVKKRGDVAKSTRSAQFCSKHPGILPRVLPNPFSSFPVKLNSANPRSGRTSFVRKGTVWRGGVCLQAPGRAVKTLAQAGEGGGGGGGGGEVEVLFEVTEEVQFGSHIRVGGSAESLGAWRSTDAAPELKWSKGNRWTLQATLPTDTDVEFKFFVYYPDQGRRAEWERLRSNRSLRIPSGEVAEGRVLSFRTKLGKEAFFELDEERKQNQFKQQILRNKTPKEPDTPIVKEAKAEPEQLKEEEKEVEKVEAVEAKKEEVVGDAVAEEAVKEKQKEEPKEPVEVLARSEVAEKILDQMPQGASLVTKLKVLEGLIGWGKKPDAETLAACNLYLTWLMSPGGERAERAEEDDDSDMEEVSRGAAEVASSVYRNLERWAGDVYSKPKDDSLQEKNASFFTSLSLRRLHSRLPSVSPSDIAVDSSSSFTPALKSQPVIERLEILRPSLPADDLPLLEDFVTAVTEMNTSEEDVTVLLDCMDKATDLRSMLCQGLQGGMRNDAPNSAIWMRQHWRLTEVALERFSQILLARTTRSLNRKLVRHSRPEDPKMLEAQWEGWACGPWALALSLQQARMSQQGLGDEEWGLDTRMDWKGSASEVRSLREECGVVVLELMRWASEDEGRAAQADHALRLQATVERAARLAEEYQSCVRSMYKGAAQTFSQGLPGFQPELAVEEEVQLGCVIQQIQELCALMRDATRDAARNQAGAHTIVPGVVVGRVVVVDSLESASLAEREPDEDTILLVKNVTGDEEPQNTKQTIKGMLVCQELLHLSGLSAKARDKRVVLGSMSDHKRFLSLASQLAGEQACLRADSRSGLSLAPASDDQSALVSLTSTLQKASGGGGDQQGSSPSAGAPAGKSADQMNITVTRSKDGRNRPEVSLESTSSNQTSSLIDRILSAVSVDETTSNVASAPASIMAMQASRGEGGGKVQPGAADSYVTAAAQVEALTTALPAGTVSELVLHEQDTVLDLMQDSAQDLDPGDGGQEALNAAKLAKVQQRQMEQLNGIKMPQSVCLPFSTLEWTLRDAGEETYARYQDLVVQSETAPEGPQLDQVCSELQSLLSSLSVSEKLLQSLIDKFFDSLSFESHRAVLRPSPNVDFLQAPFASPDLFQPEMSVKLTDFGATRAAIAKIWASLFSNRAVLSRRAAGIPQTAVAMAILVQEMVDADFSFMLNTVDPLEPESGEASVEVMVGLHPTGSWGVQGIKPGGSPWRLSLPNNPTGVAKTKSFANLSTAVLSQDGDLKTIAVEYQTQPFSTDEIMRDKLSRRLAIVSRLLEGTLEGAQEVEGVISDEDIYIIQTRPQRL